MAFLKAKTVNSGALHKRFDQAQADLIALGEEVRVAVASEREEANETIDALYARIVVEQNRLNRLDTREAEVLATVQLLAPYEDEWESTVDPAVETSTEPTVEPVVAPMTETDWEGDHIVPPAS